MRRFSKAILSIVLMQTGWVMAEPVDLPHTFTPSTPAKASEVNANLQELATAIGNLKRVTLKQGGTAIGHSVLDKLLKLDSGYLIVATKDKASANIFVKKGMDTLYYTSTNCSGTAYTDRTLTEDLLVNEIGVIGGFRDQAFYMTTPATPVANLLFNSVKHRSDGVCVNLSGYQPHAECGTALDDNGNLANKRGNLVTYNNAFGGPNCWYGEPDGTVTICQSYTDTWSSPATFLQNCSTATLESGTVLPQLALRYIDSIGVITQAYAIQPNNPAVTGVTTSACMDRKGRPAVCLPNAQLVSE